MNRKQIKRMRNTLRLIASQIVRDEVLSKGRVYKEGIDKAGNMRPNLIHHQCADCRELFRPDKIECDHIAEVGVFQVEGPLQNTKYGDCRVLNWQQWMDNLMCPISNFQKLCVRCHQVKSLSFSEDLRDWRINGGDLL